MKRESLCTQPVDVVAFLKAVADGGYHPTISDRRKEFGALLREVAKRYCIDDRKALAKAIDFASRIYHDNATLPKRDVLLLRKAISQITRVLGREGNDKLIADLMVRRADARIGRREYDPFAHGQAIEIVWQLGKLLPQLGQRLEKRSRGGRRANVSLHAAVMFLERYWQALPGKRLNRTFTPKDSRTGSPLAKSEAMRFIEAVITFIDPIAVAKLPSVTRHRLRGCQNWR